MTLKHTEGRIVIRVPLLYKNEHRMENGQMLAIERGWNNLNKSETQPVNAWVVSAEGIPEGAELLIHHNAVHDSYKIFNHDQLSGSIIAGKIDYFSIPEDQAYFWRIEQGTWNPVKGYATGLRIFRPYKGVLQGIEPKRIKDTLYITSDGMLKGKIVQTLRAADYTMIYNDEQREHRLIRLRHWDDPAEDTNNREEIICIRNDLTNELNKGKLIVGLTTLDAKPIREYVTA